MATAAAADIQKGQMDMPKVRRQALSETQGIAGSRSHQGGGERRQSMGRIEYTNIVRTVPQGQDIGGSESGLE